LKSDIQNLTTFLSQVVEDQRLLSNKLKLEMWSENEIGSHASMSLKESFEYSDEVDYPSFLTDEALSPPSPPGTAASPRSLTDLEPAGDDSTVLLDTQILDPPDQSIADDAEHLGDGKQIDGLWEDFFS
jgi:hypothetical protein